MRLISFWTPETLLLSSLNFKKLEISSRGMAQIAQVVECPLWEWEVKPSYAEGIKKSHKLLALAGAHNKGQCEEDKSR